MSSSLEPAAAADDVQTSLRRLAHATRSIDDPQQIYSILGSLTSAVASLGQSLDQVGRFHDSRNAAATSPRPSELSYRASWELHRAAAALAAVSDAVSAAHQIEAQVCYVALDVAVRPTTRRSSYGIDL